MPSTDLPVPYDALIELGLSAEQIEEALASAPLVVACQAADHPGSWFDVARVRRALAALGAFKHTKGRWAGVRLRLGQGLDPWQVVWVIAPIFGWVFHDAEIDRVVRVIRSAWVEVPRKNGKSTLSSGVSGVLLLADSEMGAEVYNAAGSTLQAGRVFEDAKRMLMTSPAARKRVEPLKEVVRVPATGGVLRVLSRVAETAHGLNVSGAIVDEVHVLRLQRALVEAIETGTGARDQPLIIFITTADEDEQGTIYDEKHQYTKNLANRVVEDARHYGVIWAAEATDDPYDEVTWRKANPGLGKSPTLAYMRGEALKAKNNPTYRPTFLRLSLNLRTADQSRWFTMGDWDQCSGGVARSKLAGRRAWGGVDLSAMSDLTAWSVWVEPITPGAELELLTRIWVPEAVVDELERKLQVPLSKWIADGFVTATEGDVIDYGAVQSAIIGDSRHFDMQTVSYDRMFAGQMVQNLQAELPRVQIWPVAQTYMGLSPAAKEWERMAKGHTFRHDGNPALRWMASVVEVKNDGLDNIRPVKPDRRKSSSRIDVIQAGVTALDGWVRRPKAAQRRKVVVRRG
jgi:phage terminase large subunit-like protein